MILFVNGAFGVGKTSVARALRRQLSRSLLFDPEKIGLPLQILARLVGHRVDDFQDLGLWRTLTVAGLRVACWLSPNVIVPMSFANPAFLDEVRTGVSRFDSQVVHVCLIAPLAVVHDRLRKRGADPGRDAWTYRRAAECCAVHGDPIFGHHIDSVGRTTCEVAEDILPVIEAELERLRRSDAAA
jgi:hypothetical protein